MHAAVDFVKWAVARAKPESIPTEADIPFPVGEIRPWEYLFGTTGIKCTQILLDERYNNFYKKKGWSREAFDIATNGWVTRGVYVCDCEGLLDAFLGAEVTANYCYTTWCTDKGEIYSIKRPWVIGEAVFVYSSSSNKMNHVGWICGFMPDGEPVVVEERGIRYGCVITKLTDRPWTHRGLVTKKLLYKENSMSKFIPVVSSPYSRGPEYLAVQQMLYSLGYLKADPNSIWGPVSQTAWETFLSDYPPKTNEVKIYIDGSLNKQFRVLEK